MYYKNNWLIWSYNDIDYNTKSSTEDIFKLRLQKTIKLPVKSYYEELIENAKNIRDLVNGPLDLLFSGGIDSEVILRIYRYLKIPINVYIFKYNDYLNYREFNHAINVCKNLNVSYKVIDFNVQKFFENDAYDIWIKCFANSSGWLPQMKFTEYLDNTPIYGSGEPYWKKRDDNSWVFELDEGSKFWTLYHMRINRKCISDWYEYRPEIILSHMKLPKIAQLLKNTVPGKLSSVSHKCIIHKDYWPDIENRTKLVGFEKDLPPSKKSKPEYMIEFEKQYTDKVVSATYQYELKEINDLLCLP